jgi:MtN3 and saliva related transmembrane protein|tara:strand:+ start:574 stop:834 length:261 start_codon:yes stop_codon:yes gene_type:complete
MGLLPVITTFLGVFAALSFFFQTIKIIKSKESKNVSLTTYIILFITALFWLMYGLSISDVPLIVSYIVGTLSTLSVIIVYFVYKKK